MITLEDIIMEINIYLTARNGNYDAKAVYEDGEIKVLKGSKIRMTFAEHIRGGRTVKKLREDSSVVTSEGVTLQDCYFTSPSTAAQFVMGSSTNGWRAWHVDRKTTLKAYLENTNNN